MYCVQQGVYEQWYWESVMFDCVYEHNELSDLETACMGYEQHDEHRHMFIRYM